MHGFYRSSAAAALILGMAGAANAGSFQLKEGSASAQGSSFAGATSGDDVTHAFWNPAVMGDVENFSIGGAVHYISPQADGTSAATGATGLDGSEDGIVPAFSIGYRVNESLVLGFNSGSPFGLATEFEPGELGPNAPGAGVVNNPRRSDLKLVQLAPIVSYDLSEQLTIAGGPTVALGKLVFETELITATGAYAELDVEDIAFGFQIGAMLKPVDWARVGVSFHSGYNLSAEGDAEVNATGIPGAFGFSTGTVNDAEVSADLPALFTLGAAFDVTEQLTLMGEFQWQNWSALDGLQFSASNIAGGTVQTEKFNYEDSVFIAVGAEYAVSDQLILRTGVGYDDTPTTDADRSARIPDEDRVWLSLGASYNVTESMKVDLAYSYLTLLEDSVANTNLGGTANTVTFEGSAHIFGIGGSLSY